MTLSTLPPRRPTHTGNGFKRSMQMSGTAIFVCVEGYNDRYYYGRACSHALRSSFAVVTSHQLPPGFGQGKGGLVAFFRRLRATGQLNALFKGKRTYFLFFLDKDVDDALNQRLRSEHVVYTDTYDLEGHLYRSGPLLAAVGAAATQLASEDVQRVFGAGPEHWLRAAAETWRGWLALCIASMRLRAGTGFDCYSRVNDGQFGQARQNLFDAEVDVLQGKVPDKDVRKVVAWAQRRVNTSFQRNEHLVLFKGKWLAAFLRNAYQRANLPPSPLSGLEKRVLATLLLNTPADRPNLPRHFAALDRACAATALRAAEARN